MSAHADLDTVASTVKSVRNLITKLQTCSQQLDSCPIVFGLIFKYHYSNTAFSNYMLTAERGIYYDCAYIIGIKAVRSYATEARVMSYNRDPYSLARGPNLATKTHASPPFSPSFCCCAV